MASTFLSMALLMFFVVIALAIVLPNAQQVVDTTTSSSKIKETESIIKIIDNNIQEALRDGYGSMRQYKFVSPQRMVVDKKDNSLETSVRIDSQLFEYGSRIFNKNLLLISGSDANCKEEDINSDGVTDFVLENSYIKVGLNRIIETSPLGNINTNESIIRIIEKTNNITINPKNSSLIIDDNPNTSLGTGFSEMSVKNNAPVCIVRFHIESNASVVYDVFYKLYTLSDFIVVDITI